MQFQQAQFWKGVYSPSFPNLFSGAFRIQNSGYNLAYLFNINGIDLGDPDKNARVLTLGHPDLDPK